MGVRWGIKMGVKGVVKGEVVRFAQDYSLSDTELSSTKCLTSSRQCRRYSIL